MTVSPDAGPATLAGLVVTASFPFYVYGAIIIIEAEEVTWSVLVRHLKWILTGLTLTTVPVVVWMIPRLALQFKGFAVLHAFFGLQAYALLAFAFSGIVRIVQVKRRHDLYADGDEELVLDDDLHENMASWRARIRTGVLGWILFWLVAWLLGVAQYVSWYVFF